MSKALDHADLMALRIVSAPASGEEPTTIDITTVACVVDRQKDINSVIAEAVAKDAGTAIVILWQGFTTLDQDSPNPRLANRYTVSVYSQPVIAGENLAADDVMESVIQRLLGWVPAGGNYSDRAQINNGGMMPDRTWLIYDCEVVIPASL